jgi:hypothetical protein
VLAFSAPLTTNKAAEAPWPTCTFSSTGATDLTKACTPPMVEGSFLLFDDRWRCKKAKAQNTEVLSAALSRAPHGSTLLVNGTTLQLEGTLHFGGATLQSHKSVRDNWPGFNESNPGHSSACNCFTIKRFIDFQLVSTGLERARRHQRRRRVVVRLPRDRADRHREHRRRPGRPQAGDDQLWARDRPERPEDGCDPEPRPRDAQRLIPR